MSYCSKCGKPIPENGICSCQQQNPQQLPFTYRRGGSAEAIYQFCGSTIMLVVSIVWSLDVLLRVMSGSKLANVPNAMIAIALWMLYIGARKQISISSFSLIHAAIIIKMVIGLLALVVLIICAGILALVSAGMRDEISSLIGVNGNLLVVPLCALAFVLVIGAVFFCIYNVKCIKISSTTRDALTGVSEDIRVSVFPIVMLFVDAAFIGIMKIVSFLSGPAIFRALMELSQFLEEKFGSEVTVAFDEVRRNMTLRVELVSLLSGLLHVVAVVIFAICLLRYRNIVRPFSVNR